VTTPYSLLFSACSAAVMSGALLDGCLGRRGISTALVLTIGLTLSAGAGATLAAQAFEGSVRTQTAMAARHPQIEDPTFVSTAGAGSAR
jgi:DHA1 family bicyclomycin/chloramphenicol resistance-like MFS transporter